VGAHKRELTHERELTREKFLFLSKERNLIFYLLPRVRAHTLNVFSLSSGIPQERKLTREKAHKREVSLTREKASGSSYVDVATSALSSGNSQERELTREREHARVRT